MEESFKLECGCESVNVNGKFITILCDEHDRKQDEDLIKLPKKTKMRITREI